MKRWVIFMLLLSIFNCDTKKQLAPDVAKEQLLCFGLAICNGSNRGTKFGMIGDSWTDLLFGTTLVEALRVQLEKYHGYNITGATLGGRTLSAAVSLKLHLKVIDEAGPDISYMLISLGGNDLQFYPGNYVGKIEEEKQKRFSEIRNNIRTMIQEGNNYKIYKWGGAPLVWIFHGYDYPSPDNDKRIAESCRPTLLKAGLNSTEIDSLAFKALDDFNDLLLKTTFEEPQMKYINLRGTLNGPPSNPSLMMDCIHPDSNGFRLIGERYVTTLKGYTKNEK